MCPHIRSPYKVFAHLCQEVLPQTTLDTVPHEMYTEDGENVREDALREAPEKYGGVSTGRSGVLLTFCATNVTWLRKDQFKIVESSNHFPLFDNQGKVGYNWNFSQYIL